MNVVPGSSRPHYSSVSLRQIISVISKGLTTAIQPKTNKTLAKYINIVSDGIKRQIMSMFCHKIKMYYTRKAHTLSLPLSLPYRHTVYTHENICANVVSAALTTLSVNSLATKKYMIFLTSEAATTHCS